jgi:hypothetical protein
MSQHTTAFQCPAWHRHCASQLLPSTVFDLLGGCGGAAVGPEARLVDDTGRLQHEMGRPVPSSQRLLCMHARPAAGIDWLFKWRWVGLGDRMASHVCCMGCLGNLWLLMLCGGSWKEDGGSALPAPTNTTLQTAVVTCGGCVGLVAEPSARCGSLAPGVQQGFARSPQLLLWPNRLSPSPGCCRLVWYVV